MMPRQPRSVATSPRPLKNGLPIRVKSKSRSFANRDSQKSPDSGIAMRVLHIGDVVGKPGRQIVNMALPALRKSEKIDFVVVNGENSAGGSGITPDGYRELLSAGTDCVTLGDHIYRRRQIMPTLRSEERILKPANYPPTSPGRGWTTLKAANDVDVAVISVIGRVFMKPVDCPFRCVDRGVGSNCPRRSKSSWSIFTPRRPATCS